MSDEPALKSPFKMDFKCFLAFNSAITPLQEVHMHLIPEQQGLCWRYSIIKPVELAPYTNNE